MTLLLAIDTSSDDVGLALFDGALLAEASWNAKLAQTATLLPRLDALLHDAGRSIGEVEAVAVASGPGSFSGLRVGMSVAKGMVLAREVAIVGVSTLLATALPHVGADHVTVAVVAAGRGRYVWAPMSHGDPEPRQGEPVNGSPADPEPRQGEPVNGSPADLVSFVASQTEPVVLCGDVPPDIGASAPAGGIIDVRSAPNLRAASVAAIGWRRWRRGEIDDPVTLEPTYVHLASRA